MLSQASWYIALNPDFSGALYAVTIAHTARQSGLTTMQTDAGTTDSNLHYYTNSPLKCVINLAASNGLTMKFLFQGTSIRIRQS